MKKLLALSAIILIASLSFSPKAIADQTGNCTAGSQYCEQNSLDTTNTTTTTNTNILKSGGARRVLQPLNPLSTENEDDREDDYSFHLSKKPRTSGEEIDEGGENARSPLVFNG